MGRNRFVRPEVVRLYLVDVHRRDLEALRTRVTPKPATADELAIAAQRVADAEADGAWIEVKRKLNAGEQRAAYGRMYLAGLDGALKVNPMQSGMALITAYLLDWSLTDAEDKPVVIRGVPLEALTATLDALDPESFTEIKEAIDAHDGAMRVERDLAKNSPATESSVSAISPSPSDAAGALSGSAS